MGAFAPYRLRCRRRRHFESRGESKRTAIQAAGASWAQFRTEYLNRLDLRDRNGSRAPIYVVPGNHDASNAIGHYTPMVPSIDKTSMAEIFNLMMSPPTPKTTDTYDYARDKVQVSHDVGGIHFVYITIWPDGSTREWMQNDLKHVSTATPVIIFAHDPPDSDSKHFMNPNGAHNINAKDKFENILTDTFADGQSSEVEPLIERKAFEDFLRRHPNITAYFHGHNNWTQFYDWTGPTHSVVLHTFRVDSPMKGHFSAIDERKLSYEIATIDTASRTMTVREVLWNADPESPNAPLSFGFSTTVALSPRP